MGRERMWSRVIFVVLEKLRRGFCFLKWVIEIFLGEKFLVKKKWGGEEMEEE